MTKLKNIDQNPQLLKTAVVRSFFFGLIFTPILSGNIFNYNFMKFFKHYILRPFLIIIIWALIFSFIAGTFRFMNWNIWLRFFAIIMLFYTFIVTDN